MEISSIIYFMLYALIGSNVIMIGLFVLRFSTLPPQIPLFYSKPWGEDQLADSWMIFLLPIILDLLFVLNNFIYKKFFPENAFVKKVMNFLNGFLIISITLIFIKIIFLIT